MSEETVLIALLCFVVGFLAREELQRFRKKSEEKKEG
jgi:Tfp pilus assembly protein PilV